MGAPLKEKILFFLKNLRNPLVNGAFFPSSASAVDAMLGGIDFSNLRTIIELGPGTGPYTAELVRRAPPNCKIILIELDADYAELLKNKFGARVSVENGGAEFLEEVLRRHEIDIPDLIVSALPFLPHPKREKFFDALRRCTESGTILRFEMLLQPWGIRVYRSLPIRKKTFVFRNIPPVWIYGIN